MREVFRVSWFAQDVGVEAKGFGGVGEEGGGEARGWVRVGKMERAERDRSAGRRPAVPGGFYKNSPRIRIASTIRAFNLRP